MLAPEIRSANAGPHKPHFARLYVQVLAAIALGVALGYFYPEIGESVKPLGDAFIKLVKMVIAPVIFLTIATGIAGMNDLQKLGRVAGKAMFYFLTFSTLALIVGLIVANVVQPGAGLNIDPASLDAQAVSTYAAKAHQQSVIGFLMNIIPSTVVGAFAEGDILQVLFFSVLFGIALAKGGETGKPVLSLLQALIAPVFKLVGILMKAAPIGAFGAMAFTIGKYGIGSMVNLAMLVATFYLTAFLFVFGVLGAVCRYNGFSIFSLIRYIKEELLLVLATSSSEAALPSLMEKIERAGAKRSVVGLVIPAGYSFNLDGTNIYMTLAALFIAQATNTDLSIVDQVLLLLVAMLSSKGSAGVTGAGFITLAATLAVVPSVPVAGLALILGVDRFMSECRALTNLVGNAVAALVIARWEGELDKAQLEAAFSGHQLAETLNRPIDRAPSAPAKWPGP
ncbi:dicarboxylate/amino acid:cation symporter (plasmid) [Mesorhizobium sp. AR07]|uniref:C4-dicarboxylate transport protein n=1 Tax=Mesorhizobium huakuii TaxID=28104 RepID=A0A7G6T5H2_9HYPH|nr:MULTISPECIES: dicarboxylate/amino acid:cation symporter [Mesorhizobium]QND62004.1 dicarboxylate/amino acid:cation symporter [Mesorhizobium huakuii]QND69375.1 dicarboxylate/amino acid:cation symporter [Mesorhizobium loti]UVK49300.1 dicarboxylate/amino acid:cation symporter [Mesorhizobium sp. AR07]